MTVQTNENRDSLWLRETLFRMNKRAGEAIVQHDYAYVHGVSKTAGTSPATKVVRHEIRRARRAAMRLSFLNNFYISDTRELRRQLYLLAALRRLLVLYQEIQKGVSNEYTLAKRA